MSVISIETRKANELAATSNIGDSSIFMVHDGTGLKKITFEDVKRAMVYPNAGSHNSIYRGKNLGSTVTQAQYTAIRNGTFDDLFIGDYWTIGSIDYRIAAFDYYLNTGDSPCISHHIVIVPDQVLYNDKMNDSSSTQGGYVGSNMYKNGLNRAKTIIKNAFNGHLLNHRLFLFTTVNNGQEIGGSQFDSEVELLSELMVYGHGMFGSTMNSILSNYVSDKTILPLFLMNTKSICPFRSHYWLRDVATNNAFTSVYSHGNASANNSDSDFGVRPFFCIS